MLRQRVRGLRWRRQSQSRWRRLRECEGGGGDALRCLLSAPRMLCVCALLKQPPRRRQGPVEVCPCARAPPRVLPTNKRQWASAAARSEAKGRTPPPPPHPTIMNAPNAGEELAPGVCPTPPKLPPKRPPELAGADCCGWPNNVAGALCGVPKAGLEAEKLKPCGGWCVHACVRVCERACACILSMCILSVHACAVHCGCPCTHAIGGGHARRRTPGCHTHAATHAHKRPPTPHQEAAPKQRRERGHPPPPTGQGAALAALPPSLSPVSSSHCSAPACPAAAANEAGWV